MSDSPPASDPRQYLHTLVKVGDQQGVLSGIRPDGGLFLRQPGGMEIIAYGEAERVELICATCKRVVLQRLFDGICADCERKRAQTLPPPRETCELCGALGAYYSPAARHFFCANCHAKNLTNTGHFAESRAREALAAYVCMGQAVEDPRHQWVRVRGSRFHCRICKSKTFVAPPQFMEKDDMPEVEVETEDL